MVLRKEVLQTLLVILTLWKASSQSSSFHSCDRLCIEGEPPLTCHYTFHVETYHSMSKACFDCPRNISDCSRPHCVPAGGIKRSVVVVNRQLPGPPIHVCLGDRIIVDVHNDMAVHSTSIHWHGVLQRSNPYMDGVPQITQCPIPPMSAFRYNFTADKPGTHMWHSHSGSQRADGAVGVLTVRIPETLDPHKNRYDADLHQHSLLLTDWTVMASNEKFAHHFHAGGDNKADTILINGKGRYGKNLSPESDPEVQMPLEEFIVQPGLKYRFRLINAVYLNCPIELSVDNHTLLVIASDGGDLEPVRADVLVSYAGERWDFIIDANQEIDKYRIRTRGILDCAPKRAHQEAILRYEGAEHIDIQEDVKASYEWVREGMYVNPLNRAAGSQNSLTTAELHQLRKSRRERFLVDPALKQDPDMQFILSYDFFGVNNPSFNVRGLYGINEVMAVQHRTYTPQLNYISMQLPPFPLLPQRDEIKPNMFCNESSLAAQGRNCKEEFCACTHVIEVPLGSVGEVILVDEGQRYDANHPFHLHGHAFRVVSLDRVGKSVTVDEIKRLDKAGLIRRNLVNPPVKDTVSVPDGGYVAIRVHFNNPGYWLFHCHIDFHVELGMALVFKVGNHSEMPPAPPGFPKCGNWFGEHENVPEPNSHAMPQVTENVDHFSDYDEGAGALFLKTQTVQTKEDTTTQSVASSVNKLEPPADTRNSTVDKDGSSVDRDFLAFSKSDPAVVDIGPTAAKTVSAEYHPVTSLVDTVTEIASTVAEVASTTTDVSASRDVDDRHQVRDATDRILPLAAVTVMPTEEKKYPNEMIQTSVPTTSLNIKNLFLLYSESNSNLKKDQLSHNEVSKGLISIIEPETLRKVHNEEPQGSVMRIPPRFKGDIAGDKKSTIALERKTRGEIPFREPVRSELYKNTAVNVKLGPTIALTLSLLLFLNSIL